MKVRFLGVVALNFALTLTARAQYSANNQTNTVSAVTSNWVGNGTYVVGSNWVFDALNIVNGGVLSNGTGIIGYEVGANNNSVLVSGPGSLWKNTGDVLLGLNGTANTLTISNAGAVVASTLNAQGGILILMVGALTVSQLVLTNGANSAIVFGGGTLNTGGTTVSNGQLFVIGDGTDTATLNLTGGAHTFVAGVSIAMNGTLTGSGSISGQITNSGVIEANGSTLTFFGSNGAKALTNSTIVMTNGGAIVFSGTDSWTLACTVLNGGGTLGGSLINSNSGGGKTVFLKNPSMRSNGGTLMVLGGAGINYTQIGSILTNNYVITGNGSFTGNFGTSNFGILNQGTIASLSGLALVLDSRDAANIGGMQIATNGTFVVANSGTLVILRTPNAWTNATAKFPTNSGTIFMQGGTLRGQDTNTPVSGVASLFVNSALGVIHGCGTFENFATVQNNGSIYADCGGTFTFTGSFTNNGLWQALSGSTLEVDGTLVNNGTVDASQGHTNFLGAVINNGTIIVSPPLPTITAIRAVSGSVQFSFTTINGNSYSVQTNGNLVTGAWTTFTNGVAGTGGIVTIVDPGATSATDRFYRLSSP